MQYPLYQAAWHDKPLPPHIASLPRHAQYDAVYREEARTGFQAPESWFTSKKKQADIFAGELRGADRILSIGAGLGVIEKHLIDAGLKVDLQECQGESFNWFRQQMAGREMPTLYESKDLSIIPSNSYDAILVVSVVYVFDNRQYIEFLRECRRILRPAGKLIVWDHDAHMPIGLLLRPLRRNWVRWGLVRTPDTQMDLIAKGGFTNIVPSYYGIDLNLLEADPFRVFGVQMRNGKSHAQMFTAYAT